MHFGSLFFFRIGILAEFAQNIEAIVTVVTTGVSDKDQCGVSRIYLLHISFLWFFCKIYASIIFSRTEL